MAMRFVSQRKRQRTQTKDARSTALVPVSKQQAEVNLARKVAQLSKYVKGLKPEMKFADISLSATNVSPTTGVTTLMSSIAAGAGVNQRVGENVQIKYIEMHFEAIFAGSVASSTNDNPSYRVYIVQDKQQVPNVSPALSDLVDQPSTPTVQLFNVQEQKRFRVIYDSGPQVCVFGTAAGVGNSSIALSSRILLNIKKRVSISTEFNGTANTNIQKNGIYFIVSTDMLAAAVPCFDYFATSRIGYIDV